MAQQQPQEQQTLFWCDTEAGGFQIVKQTAEDNGIHTVEPIEGSLFPKEKQTSMQLKKSDLHSTLEGVDELVYLRYFSPASVVNSLRWRFLNDSIYTHAGLMTVAVNPFKRINKLYSEEQILSYSKSVEHLSRPHVYAVAQLAYRNMKTTQVDQTILVSGLSGSGKTETVKFTIHYLSSIAGAGQGTLEQQINVAGLLLESFGNAATVLNSNSSRFGKYTRIYFDKAGHMAGAEIKTYLLEKSRVSNAPENERNFHIFYHLLNGLSDKELTELFSPRGTKFNYLRESTDGLGSAASIDSIRKQLSLLSFTEVEQQSLFKILVGILHLGNVQFEAKGEESAVASSSQTALWNAAALLGVSLPALQKCLTTLDLKSSNQTIALNKVNAELSRDSLAKDIYERVFGWIVKKLNATIGLSAGSDVDDYSHVSILDISGYEDLAQNSLEQLCINYTNDKLQQLFNGYVYKEQELYQDEGIGWKKIDFDMDLQASIGLVDRKPDGLFGLLDQVCYRLDATDADLLNEIALVHKSNQLIKVTSGSTFTIQHGPSTVTYTIGSFLVKNRDIMASSLENLMSGSKDALLAELFKSGRPRSLNTSVTSFFRNQMDALLEMIGETDCSYIKCIRPNRESQAGVFDSQYVCEQIRWSGVLETIELCDKGYPSHIEYNSFLDRYSELPSAAAKSGAVAPRERAEALLQDTLKPKEYALGNSMLFLAMGSHFKLDLMLESVRRQSPRDAPSQSKSFWQRTRETWGWMFN